MNTKMHTSIQHFRGCGIDIYYDIKSCIIQYTLLKNDINSDLDFLGATFCIKKLYRIQSNLFSGGALPLIFCIHVRLGPIYWGGYLPCKKSYKVMVFYM